MLILNIYLIACETATLTGHYLNKSNSNMGAGKSREQGLRA